MTIYDNIKAICTEKGITLSSVENDLGLERSNIYKWQICDPGSTRLKAVAEYLGVTIDRLLENVPAWEPKKTEG